MICLSVPEVHYRCLQLSASETNPSQLRSTLDSTPGSPATTKINHAYIQVCVCLFVCVRMHVSVQTYPCTCTSSHVYQGCTTRSPWAGSGPRTCYIRPWEQVKKYKKHLLIDGDL